MERNVVTGIDKDRAIEWLQNFLQRVQLRYSPPGRGFIGPGTYNFARPKEEAQGAAQTVEPILDAVLPGWRTADWEEERSQPMWRHREAANRAIAVLREQENIADILGDGAPTISAGALHAWVWDSAKTLWSSGHFRESVNAAARAVNAQAQAKLNRRDESEWKLINDAFRTAAPENGRPRLRLMADDGSSTYTSVHEGAGFFARGLYQGIRNPSNHDDLDELTEHEALEQLAAFSILARWIDVATVTTL
jgi:hypothetical protein